MAAVENPAKYDTIGLFLDTYYRSSILLLGIPAQGVGEYTCILRWGPHLA